MTVRPRQLAFLDGMERPVGPIPPSVFTGSNADLIAAIAPLYLGGDVLDTTYGLGKWWDRHRPDELTAHDLALDGVDFRALPHEADTFDAVCFDPPYIPQGGYTTSTEPDFVARFGLTSRSRGDLWELIEAGLGECARVSRRWVLTKCCDFVNGGAFHLGHVKVIDMAARLGLRTHDLIVHATGPGPGGHNIDTILRARRAHSYLLVFEKRRRDVVDVAPSEAMA